MSPVAVIGIVFACVVVAALVTAVALRATARRGGRALRGRFGPEYDRVLERHAGDEASARAELTDRIERHAELGVRPLDPESRGRHEQRWNGVQERFVDDPARAVTEADALVGRVLTERGYPEADPGERADTLSVDHPHHVHHFRAVHDLAARTANGTANPGTEEAREALLRARELFEEIVAPDEPTRGRAARAARRTAARQDAARGDAAGPEPQEGAAAQRTADTGTEQAVADEAGVPAALPSHRRARHPAPPRHRHA